MSPLLRLLQDCLDRQSWRDISRLRDLATARVAVQPRPMLERSLFPVDEWWRDLPVSASHVPREWRAFDMSDAIVLMGLSRVKVGDILRSPYTALHALSSGSRLRELHG